MRSKREISVKTIEKLRENSICLNKVTFLRELEGKTEEVMLGDMELEGKSNMFASTENGMTTFITKKAQGEKGKQLNSSMYVTFDPKAKRILSVIGLQEVEKLYNPLEDEELTIKDPEVKKKINRLKEQQQVLERE